MKTGKENAWVLFDLDGTLTRSEEGIWNSFRHVARRMNLPEPAPETLRKVIGPPLIWSFRNCLGMTEAEALRAQEIYRERYNTVGLFENRVYPGVRTMLRILSAQGLRIGLVSGKPEEASRRILDHFGLLPWFERIRCATDGHAEKEALIRQAVPESGAEIWMVGDRKFDVEGGRKAGVHTLGVTWGYGSEEELRTAGAETIAHAVGEVAKILCPDAPIPEGAFLAMEGLDGCGKGTQLDRLTDTLDRYGFEVRLSREPGGTPLGEKIRELLLDPENTDMEPETEALLYAASRAQHVREVIRPAIREGKIVLCDRFLDSSAAYQGGGRKLGVDRVLAINEPATDGMLPELTVYLKLGHRASLDRLKGARTLDRLELERDDFFARTEAAYEALTGRDSAKYVIVDASRSREEVAKEISERVLAYLFAKERTAGG